MTRLLALLALAAILGGCNPELDNPRCQVYPAYAVTKEQMAMLREICPQGVVVDKPWMEVQR